MWFYYVSTGINCYQTFNLIVLWIRNCFLSSPMISILLFLNFISFVFFISCLFSYHRMKFAPLSMWINKTNFLLTNDLSTFSFQLLPISYLSYSTITFSIFLPLRFSLDVLLFFSTFTTKPNIYTYTVM